MSNSETVCRLCASSFAESDLIQIKSDASISLDLEKLIHQFYNVIIAEDDFLPKTICITCCDKVNSFNDFHHLVQSSQEVLINKFISVKEITVKNEKIEESEQLVELKLEISDTLLEDKYEDYESSDDNWEDDLPLSQRITKVEDNESLEQEPSQDVERKVKQKVIWKCDDCAYETDIGTKFRIHCSSEHNKEPVFSCSKCSKTYNRYESYQAHRRSHKQGQYRCEICGNSYKNKAYIKEHRKLHSDYCPFTCSHCKKTFKTAYLLKSHQRIHLPDELKLQFECDVCGKKFTRKQYLVTHKEMHTGKPDDGKDFVCDQCGRSFKQKGTLSQHMSTHVKECLFNCDQCPKAFKDLYALRRHQKTHTPGELYNCDICSRPFKHKKALRRHRNIHTTNLPYECEYCKKRFREKTYLKIHLRQHTGEKPYSCTDCFQRFTNDSNFIKHIRARHGLERFSIANQRQFPFLN